MLANTGHSLALFASNSRHLKKASTFYMWHC